MSGSTVCYKPDMSNFHGKCFNWQKPAKDRKVAVVRPVMKEVSNRNEDSTSIIETRATVTSSAAAAAVATTDVNRNALSRHRISQSLTDSSHGSASAGEAVTIVTRSTSSIVTGSDEWKTTPPSINGNGLSSFYYPNLTMLEAKRLLKPHPEGTFLLRKSSEPHYAFSLSVKTKRGTTSVRILRTESGHFRLDCDPTQQHISPRFNSVSELINHYLDRNAQRENSDSGAGRTNSEGGDGGSGGHRYVFLESTGRMDTPLIIIQPLIREGGGGALFPTSSCQLMETDNEISFNSDSSN